jgi:hypothetical protein
MNLKGHASAWPQGSTDAQKHVHPELRSFKMTQGCTYDITAKKGVLPAKAGIQKQLMKKTLDSGLRRSDELLFTNNYNNLL